jgi:hypothetical protein
MKSAWRTHLEIGLMICAFLAASGQISVLYSQPSASSQISVDLRGGLFGGKPVPEWTLAQVTDSFGRPNAVADEVEGILGPQLHYHVRGLSFWFRPKGEDPEQHLWILTIYLARSWDNVNSAWYDAFNGRLAPAVDANWKQSRLLSEFAAFNPTVKTVEDFRREMIAAGMRNTGVRGPQTDFVYFTTGDLQVSFAVEPNTKFVERISIRPKESQSRRP